MSQQEQRRENFETSKKNNNLNLEFHEIFK